MQILSLKKQGLLSVSSKGRTPLWCLKPRSRGLSSEDVDLIERSFKDVNVVEGGGSFSHGSFALMQQIVDFFTAHFN